MKLNKLSYIAAALLALTAATSCKSEIDDIFDKSAAERIEDAISDYTKVLTSAPNGWVMQYFATDEEKGYIYYMNFKADGSVVIASDNEWIGNTYKEETSVFQVIGDDGPVLTFNSYNTLFHLFADPNDVPEWGGRVLGEGHKGDYEFRVMGYDEATQTMTLRGKKRNIEILLTQLPAGVDPEQYFADLKEKRPAVLDERVTLLYLTTPKHEYIVYDMASCEIGYFPVDGDQIADIQYATCVFNGDGIRFATPLELDGATVQNFKLNSAGILECVDKDQTATLSPGKLYDVFTSVNYAWQMDSQSLTGSVADAYQAVVDESKAKTGGFGQNFRYFLFDIFVDADGVVHPALSFRNGNATGHFYLDKNEAGDNGVKFAFTGSGDAVALRYMELENGPTFTTKAYQDFIALLTAGEWTITANSAMAPTELTFVNKNNTADTFKVVLQ